MQPAPSDPKLWDEYLLMMCQTRLALILEKEKNQSEVESFALEMVWKISDVKGLKHDTNNLLMMFNHLSSPTFALWKMFSTPLHVGFFREDFSLLINKRVHYTKTYVDVRS